MSFFKSLALVTGSAIGTALLIDHKTDGLIKDMFLDMRDEILDIDEDDDFEDEDLDGLDGVREYIHKHNIDSAKTSDTLVISTVDDQSITVLLDPNDPKNNDKAKIIMPLNDAINLYSCIEEAVEKIDPEGKSDYNCFGDKAISFERLYDSIEDILDEMYANAEALESEIPEDNAEEFDEPSVDDFNINTTEE